VRSQRQVVDYALQRRSLLAEVRAGRVGVGEVCDAGPYLLRAARYHGRPSATDCPICRRTQLTQVCWVFGDGLRHAAGSARSPEELERLAATHADIADISVYVVEVCRSCAWNHLVLSYVLGTGGHPETAPGRRRSAAE